VVVIRSDNAGVSTRLDGQAQVEEEAGSEPVLRSHPHKVLGRGYAESASEERRIGFVGPSVDAEIRARRSSAGVGIVVGVEVDVPAGLVPEHEVEVG
jgi:hypothetical protein